MNYLEAIEKAVIFIEENLCENIRVEEIAEVANYSYYHFHRIFQAAVGESVGNYLRRRRLTKAAYDLIYTNKKILDIALRYQFKSQESFSRAFKDVYGTAPGTYRSNRIDQFLGKKSQLDSLRLEHLHKGITINPVIRIIADIKVVGMRGKTKLDHNRIPELWRFFLPHINEIKSKKEPLITFGVCELEPELRITKFQNSTDYSELVGVKVNSFADIPSGMVKKTIPAGKYAVFIHKGNINKLSITYDYIWGTWVPYSDFEVSIRDNFQTYDERFLGPENDNSEIDIYIPIK